MLQASPLRWKQSFPILLPPPLPPPRNFCFVKPAKLNGGSKVNLGSGKFRVKCFSAAKKHLVDLDNCTVLVSKENQKNPFEFVTNLVTKEYIYHHANRTNIKRITLRNQSNSKWEKKKNRQSFNVVQLLIVALHLWQGKKTRSVYWCGEEKTYRLQKNSSFSSCIEVSEKMHRKYHFFITLSNSLFVNLTLLSLSLSYKTEYIARQKDTQIDHQQISKWQDWGNHSLTHQHQQLHTIANIAATL